MRTTLCLFCVVLFLRGFALYNGNPSFPMMPEQGAFISPEDWFGVKVGYQFDDVYDRKLRLAHRHMDGESKKVPAYDSISNQGVLTFNFNDRVELFGTCGVFSFDLTQSPFEETRVRYRAGTHLAWGIGGRAILAYWGDLQIGVNAAYLQSNLPLSSVRVNHESYSPGHSQAQFREWQVGAGVSYRSAWLSPYAGVDYSDFRTKIEHLNSLAFLFHSNHMVFKEEHPFGIFLGLGISPYKGFNINFECRFINENAASASGDFKF